MPNINNLISKKRFKRHRRKQSKKANDVVSNDVVSNDNKLSKSLKPSKIRRKELRKNKFSLLETNLDLKKSTEDIELENTKENNLDLETNIPNLKLESFKEDEKHHFHNNSKVDQNLIDSSNGVILKNLQKEVLENFNKCIWCLHPDCLTSVETFDTYDDLNRHMSLNHQ